MDCLDCLSITKVPTISAATACATKAPTVGGYQGLFLLHCGVKMETAVPNQDPISAFLAGTAMPLTPAAITIAEGNGAPAGTTTTATIAQCVTWGLMGTFGAGIRGSLVKQDSITAQGGSCEQPSIVNNVWRINAKMTRVGHAGAADYDMINAYMTNQKAYNIIVVECGETTGAIFLKNSKAVVSDYNFNRPEDGIREYLERGLSWDTISLLEPKSYAFPVYSDVIANFT